MFGGLKGRDHSFRRTENPKDHLHPFEQEILAGLFPGGAATSRLSGLKNKFYTRLPAIQRKMYDEVRHRGYFATAPDSARGVWRGIGIVVLVVAFFGEWPSVRSWRPWRRPRCACFSLWRSSASRFWWPASSCRKDPQGPKPPPAGAFKTYHRTDRAIHRSEGGR
jgi:hypothetical protein